MSNKQTEKDYSHILSHDSKTHCPIETALEMLRHGQIREPETAEAIIATFKELLPKPKQLEYVPDYDADHDGNNIDVLVGGTIFFVIYKGIRFWEAYSTMPPTSSGFFNFIGQTPYETLQEAKDACQQAFDKFVLSLLEGV